MTEAVTNTPRTAPLNSTSNARPLTTCCSPLVARALPLAYSRRACYSAGHAFDRDTASLAQKLTLSPDWTYEKIAPNARRK
jgi:hypothetical protein